MFAGLPLRFTERQKSVIFIDIRTVIFTVKTTNKLQRHHKNVIFTFSIRKTRNPLDYVPEIFSVSRADLSEPHS